MNNANQTPKQNGFHMPAEHEPHAAIWMAWPDRADNWRYGAKPAQEAFINVAKAISKTTPVTMIVNADQYQNARYRLPEDIQVIEMSTNDSWMRDIGPSYVVNNKERMGIDWEFNSWGAWLMDFTSHGIKTIKLLARYVQLLVITLAVHRLFLKVARFMLMVTVLYMQLKNVYFTLVVILI